MNCSRATPPSTSMAPRKHKEVEDPNNTWSQQFMAACLSHQRSDAEAIILKGAVPTAVREPTPFSKGDRLSPLIAVLLQGNLTPATLEMASFLLGKGCTLDDPIPLPDIDSRIGQLRQLRTGLETGAAGGSIAHVESPRKAPSDEREQPYLGSNRQPSGEPSSPPLPVPVDEGSVLHYLIAHGDHAHLLKLLILTCDVRPGLPHSLLREVEAEMSLPAPIRNASAVDSVPRSGRGKRPKGSTSSRRASVRGGRVPERAELMVSKPVTTSPLPTLTQHPPVGSETYRVFTQTSPQSVKSEDVAPAPAVPTSNGDDTAMATPTLAAADTDAECDTARSETPHARLNLGLRTTVSQMTPVEYALAFSDTLAVRLLTYFGAPTPFGVLVNGSQTALARACTTGDVPLIEKLLDAGDSLSQVSADGRYTLIHYAVGQPQVLDYLIRRGLSIDVENAFGESALVSLIRYGTGRNAEYAAQEAPRMSDAPKLSALPYCVLRNYILTPLVPLVLASRSSKVASATASGANSARGGKAAAAATAMREAAAAAAVVQCEEQRPTIGGGEMGTWWSFTSLPTADLIHRIVECGADVHGCIPTEELGLSYVQFADEAVAATSNFAVAASAQRASGSGSVPREGKAPKSSLGRFSRQQQLEETVDNNSLASGVPLIERTFPHTAEISKGRIPARATPLMHAIMGYHPELIRRLVLEYRVDVMRRDSQGACALHYAALCTEPSVMELLVTSIVPNADGCVANTIDMAGRTPLHYAAATGNSAVIVVLLNLGLFLNAGSPDKRGLTPLHVAVLANETACVELLLRHSDNVVGSTAASTNKRSAPVSRSGRGRSTNHHTIAPSLAASTVSGCHEYTMVDVEAEDKERGATALEMAILDRRDPAIVRLLLAEGRASMQRSSGLDNGGTLLHRAVFDNEVEYVRLLLEHFADSNEPDEADCTPLLIAVDRDEPRVDVITCLLAAGASVSAQSVQTLRTPLLVAAERGHPKVIMDLLWYREHPVAAMAARLRKIRVIASPVESLPTPGQLSFGGGGSLTLSTRKQRRERVVQTELSDTHSLVSEETPTDYTLAENAAAESIPRILIAEGNFLLTDASTHTVMHLLCSHTDPAKRANVLPVITDLIKEESISVRLCTAIDSRGRLPLHAACDHHFVEAVRLLLNAYPTSVYATDSNGSTPLHACVAAAHYPATPFLSTGILRFAHGSFPRRPGGMTTDSWQQNPECQSAQEADADRLERVREEVESCLDAVAQAVRSTVPAAGISGFTVMTDTSMPICTDNSSTDIKSQLPISLQLLQRYMPRTRKVLARHPRPSERDTEFTLTEAAPSMHSLGGVPMIQSSSAAKETTLLSRSSRGIFSGNHVNSFTEYAQLVDGQGRTAMLLAGERGDVVAASKLVRLVEESNKADGHVDTSVIGVR